MIDNKVREHLSKLQGEYDFISLLNFCEQHKINLKAARIKDGLGFACRRCIYLDINKLATHQTKMVYWLILHEVYHYKRIKKMGVKKMVKDFSDTNFETFSQMYIQEEMGADRYASLMFYKFTRENYPINWTQQLSRPIVREHYKKELIPMLFGKISNLKEYDSLVKSIISEI